jgi:hypothetical protein
MLDPKHTISKPNSPSIYIEKSGWIRAKCSGLLHDYNTIGTFVKKGNRISNHYRSLRKIWTKSKANDGYVIQREPFPIVYGDAIYHLSNTNGRWRIKLNCDRNTKVAALTFWYWYWGKSLAVANKILTLPIWETRISIFSCLLQNKKSKYRIYFHLLSGKTKKLSFQRPILKPETWLIFY